MFQVAYTSGRTRVGAGGTEGSPSSPSQGIYLCAYMICHCVFLSAVCGVHLYSACVSTECVCEFGNLFYMCVLALWLSIMVVSMLTDLDLCGFPLYRL